MMTRNLLFRARGFDREYKTREGEAVIVGKIEPFHLDGLAILGDDRSASNAR